MVTQDLNKIQGRKAWDPMEIRKGIKQLEDKKNIVIRPADKGGAIVILSKELYKKEKERQLEDVLTYQKLLSKPTLYYKKTL